MERFRFALARPWLMVGMGLCGLALVVAVGVAAAQAGGSSLSGAVAPAAPLLVGGGSGHPAAFYGLHNDTSCEVPDVALAVATVPSPVAEPTRVHLHTLMCEPTEGPDAALPVPNAPLP